MTTWSDLMGLDTTQLPITSSALHAIGKLGYQPSDELTVIITALLSAILDLEVRIQDLTPE